MPPEPTRPCPVCTSAGKRVLFRQVFGQNQEIALLPGYTVVACTECGFCFADGIPPQSAFDGYYISLSKYEHNDQGGVASPGQMAQYARIASLAAGHLPDPAAAILDAGCATGALLSLFRARGYGNLHGIDPSPACARYAREVYGISATADTIQSFAPGRRFDLVMVSAVLEHVADLTGVLEKIRRLLADGGLLFIEVPDAHRFDRYISAPFQQFSLEHINYFSDRSLRNLLFRHGFTAVEIQAGENRADQAVDPDIMALFRKGERKDGPVAPDPLTAQSLEGYIQACTAAGAALHRTLREKVLPHPRIIVWGAGTHTQRLIGAGFDLTRVAYFVDSNTRYAGKTLAGKEIRLPSGIREAALPILISSPAFQREIARTIKEILKLPNPVIELY